MNLGDILRRAPEFAVLPTKELETLASSMVVRDYPDGYQFIKEGKPGDSFYIIIEGQVDVTRKTVHGVAEINHHKQCQSFGMVSLIDHGKRTASCTARGPVKVASLPRQAFEMLYNANIPLANHFLHIVARQLRNDMRNLSNQIRKAMAQENKRDVTSALIE